VLRFIMDCRDKPGNDRVGEPVSKWRTRRNSVSFSA
jgi:hypothetical protein